MSAALREMHEANRAHDAWLFGEFPALAKVRHNARETTCVECRRDLIASPHAYWCSRRVRRKGEPEYRNIGTTEQIQRRIASLLSKPTVGALRREHGYPRHSRPSSELGGHQGQ